MQCGAQGSLYWSVDKLILKEKDKTQRGRAAKVGSGLVFPYYINNSIIVAVIIIVLGKHI